MEFPLYLNHKKIKQSYILSAGRYKSSVYEKRILYRLVELAQYEIKGIVIKDNLRCLHHTAEDVAICMPIRSILVTSNEDSINENYDQVIKACRLLAKKYFEFQDESGNYFGDSFIYNVRIEKRSGLLNFKVADWIWSIILNFTKGYHEFDIGIAMQLRSTYSMRFLELLSGQKPELTFTVQELRKILGLEDKYKNFNDLKRRVIVPAQKELDKISPKSFTFKPKLIGKQIVSIKFSPVFHPENKNEELQKIENQASLEASLQLKGEIYGYLKTKYEFTAEEINRNKSTLIEGQALIPDFIYFLSKLVTGSRTAINRKGYVIGAIKRKIEEIRQNQHSGKGTYEIEKKTFISQHIGPTDAVTTHIAELSAKFKVF